MRLQRIWPLGGLVLAAIIPISSGCNCADAELVARIVSAIFPASPAIQWDAAGPVLVLRAGDTATIAAIEKNTADDEAGQHRFDLQLFAVAADSSITEVGVPLTLSVGGLGGGDSVPHGGKFTASEAGEYVIKAIADALGQVCETNESNNEDETPSDSLGGSLRIRVIGEARPRAPGSAAASLHRLDGRE